jgi:protease-4
MDGGGEVLKNSVMIMDLKGVIFDSKKFLRDLKDYREDDSVKAIVIRVNSPGGVVGPSQEINAEIRRTREEFKKPVVVYSESLDASGAYYASVAADKIVVSPGVLIGSIGVIMEFANLHDLYKWAKIDRYVVKSGEFKDIGSEYRPMTVRERAYLQNLINQVLAQFKGAIMDGRHIAKEKLDAIADGRIFTGTQAKALNLVDAVGSLQTAINMAGELAHLGKNPETFEIPKERPNLWDFLMDLKGGGEDDDSITRLAGMAARAAGLQLGGHLLAVYPAALPGSLLGSFGEKGR